MSSTCRLSFFGVDVSTSRPSNSNWGSGSFNTNLAGKLFVQINKLSSHDMAYDFRRTCQKSGADNERLMRNRRLGQRRNTAEAKRSGHGDGIGGRCKGGYRWGKCRYNKIRPTLDRGSANSRRDRSKTNARGCQARGLSIELGKRQRRTRNAPKRGRHW